MKKTVTRKAPVFGSRSLIYAVMGNLKQAFEDAEMSYSIDSNDDEAKRAMSLAYTLKGNPDEALKILGPAKDDFDKFLIALAYAKSGTLKGPPRFTGKYHGMILMQITFFCGTLKR